AWRRQLLRRRRDARPPRRRRPRGVPLLRHRRLGDQRRQPQRLGAQHRRHFQCHEECPGNDAASGERDRPAARLDDRQAALRQPGGRPRLMVTAAAKRPNDLMGLSNEEYDRVVAIMGRTPSHTELGIFSVMWSEHCSYKSSKKWLKTLPTTGDRVI